MSDRRRLQFDDLEQVVIELERLRDGGYTATGNWNLSQVAGHLNDWMRYAIDGYPRSALPIRAMLWLMKVTIGRRQLETVIEKKKFRDSLPTMPATVPAPDAHADAEAVDQLVRTIRRLQGSSVPIHASPLYGPMTYDEAVQLHLVHCAHHLSFLNPND